MIPCTWLRLVVNRGVYVKVGRSFNTKERFKSLNTAGAAVTIIDTLTDNHKEIYNMEMAIHNHLYSLGLHRLPTERFGGSVNECFDLKVLDTYKNLQQMLDIIKESL